LSITDSSGSTPVTYTYQYDNLHRLLSEDVAGALSPPTTSEALVFTYNDPDHINAVSSISYNGTNYNYTYDPNGNMLTGPDFTNPSSIVTRSINWNADNMPVSVTRGSTTISLTYDGNGARAKKVAGGITTYYVSSDYEIKNGVATKYVFAGNMRVASIEGTNINNSKIFHKDHLGSSVAITDNTGADLEATEYMPFGVQRSHSGTNASDYKYTDQELDNESGLYNYDARLYDPIIGRFISPDTVIQSPYNPQTLNRYSYCVNNPMKYTDPSGHTFFEGLGGIYSWMKNFFTKNETPPPPPPEKKGLGSNGENPNVEPITPSNYDPKNEDPDYRKNAIFDAMKRNGTKINKNDISYNPGLRGAYGHTIDANGKVEIGPSAFEKSFGFLAATIEHEMVHYHLWSKGLYGDTFNNGVEVVAYQWVLDNRDKFGLSETELQFYQDRKDSYYNNLTREPKIMDLYNKGKLNPF
jgi:RHS repeat-associated protein